MLTIGVVKTSFKEHEQRVPIYPEHVLWIDKEIRKNIFFEEGYGHEYGFSDDFIAKNSRGCLTRDELFKNCDLILLAKPVVADLQKMKEHQILCGWSHCVQQHDIAQAAIERKLTIIAWEAMNCWSNADHKLLHIFYRNNELAGYAAVLHVLQLRGVDGHYGPRRHVAVISYGAVSRGAIYALQGRGFNNIHVYTQRPVHLVADQNPDVYYAQYFRDNSGNLFAKLPDGSIKPFIDELALADIICNGILQDTDTPYIFVNHSQISKLKPNSIIIDISCDKGMGFSFAQPTTFEKPAFKIGNNILYYSVDHTPAYLWDAASREISRALIPYLPILISGNQAWQQDETVRRAIEIQDGSICNDKILRFQNRENTYPYIIKQAR